MRIGLLAVLAIALVGCPSVEPAPADDDTTAPTDDDDDSADLVAEIVSVYPEDGTTDAYYRTDIEVVFDRAASNVAITLVEDGGDVITGDLTMDCDDTRATFDPYGGDDSQLAPSTNYTATVTWDSHDPAEVHFQTSEVGAPVEDPQNRVVGHDYVLDLGTATFTEPPGVGSLLAQYIAEYGVALRIEAIDGTTIEALGANLTADGDGWTQDLCVASLDWDAAGSSSWDNPHLRIGPAVMLVDIEGYRSELVDSTVSASFSPDGERLAGGLLEALMPLHDLDLEGDIDCEMLEQFGIECVVCPHNPERVCLPVAARDIAGERATITGIHPETGEEVIGLTEVTAEMVEAWENAGLCP